MAAATAEVEAEEAKLQEVMDEGLEHSTTMFVPEANPDEEPIVFKDYDDTTLEETTLWEGVSSLYGPIMESCFGFEYDIQMTEIRLEVRTWETKHGAATLLIAENWEVRLKGVQKFRDVTSGSVLFFCFDFLLRSDCRPQRSSFQTRSR